MKRPCRSVAGSLFFVLAVASAFVVAIAGCSGSNDGASTSALEGLDASQVKDDDLTTLNVGSDLYPPFVYTDEYGDIVGLDVEILTDGARERVSLGRPVPCEPPGSRGRSPERYLHACRS